MGYRGDVSERTIITDTICITTILAKLDCETSAIGMKAENWRYHTAAPLSNFIDTERAQASGKLSMKRKYKYNYKLEA